MADASTVSELKAKISVEGADEAQAKMNALHGKTEETGSAFKRALGSVGGFVAGFGIMEIADAAISTLVGKMHEWIQGAQDAQVAQAQTNQILASGSHVIGLTTSMVDQLAQKYMNLTGVDDDLVHSAENILAGFQNISLKAFPGAIEASINLAESFKMTHGGALDMTRAAQTLGRALEDPEHGAARLRMFNVILSESQKEQIKQFMKVNDVAGAQAVIMDAVRAKVGGAADAFGSTNEGKLMRFNTGLDNIGKTLASVALPLFSDLLDAINPLIYAIANGLGPVVDTVGKGFSALTDYLEPLRGVFQNISAVVQDLAGAFAGSFGQSIKGVGDNFKGMLPNMMQVAHSIELFISNVGDAARGPIQAFGTALGGLIKGGLGALHALLSGPLMASLRNTAETMRGMLLPVVQNLGNWFQNSLLPTLKSVAPQFASLAEAIGGIVVPTVIFLYSKLQLLEAFIAANVIPVIEAIIPPIIQFAGFLAGALADGLKAVTTVIGPLLLGVTSLNTQTKPVRQTMEDVGHTLSEHVAPAAKVLSEHVSTLTSHAKDFADAVGKRVQPIVDNLKVTFDRIAPPVVSFSNAVGVRLQPILDRMGIAINTIILPILKFLADMFSKQLADSLQVLSAIWSAVWPSLSNILSVAWDVIQTVITVAWDIISNTILIGLDLLGGNWKQAWKDMQTEFKSVGDAIFGLGKRLMQDLLNTIEQIGKNIQTASANIWTGVKNKAGDTLHAMIDGISHIVGGLPGFFGSLGQRMISALGDAIRNGVGAIGNALKYLFEQAFKNLPGGGFHFPGFAEGTNSAPGGLARVGEGKYAELVIGPHLMNLERGSQVVPVNLSGQQANNAATVHQHFAAGAIVINGAGMSAEDIHDAWMRRAAFLARGRGNG